MTDNDVKVFLSYSHRDEKLCLELQKHLNPLRRAKVISNWYDREIKPGEDWDNNIKKNIKESDIILFLISPDFLNSEYIYENEIKQAIEQHNAGVSAVVPIMLRKCDIEFTPFKHIQGLPTDLEPINSRRWFTMDDAFFDIIEGLKRIIGKTKERKSILTHEEIIWNKAKNDNSIEGYLGYLKSSKLKVNLDKAIQSIGTINSKYLGDYNQLKSTDRLELELLQRERKKISMELHDDVGSRLSIIKLMLGTQDIKNEVKEDLNLALEEVTSSIRKISRSLFIDYSENEFDLKEAILELQTTVLKTSKIDFILEMKNIENTQNPQLEINVFRIIQELVNNVIEHSRASKLEIVILKSSELLTLTVSDNGIGFNYEKKYEGIGLKNIRARIKYYNGTEERKIGKHGSTFIITIPTINSVIKNEKN